MKTHIGLVSIPGAGYFVLAGKRSSREYRTAREARKAYLRFLATGELEVTRSRGGSYTSRIPNR